MRTQFICLALIIGLLCPCAPAQWQVRLDGLPRSSIFQAVALADSGAAWVTGGGELWRSTNLGRTWLPTPISPAYGNPCVLAAVTRISLVYGTDRGKIVRTTNGGASWAMVFDDSSVTPFINDLAMFDSLQGWAIGDPPDSTRCPGLLKTSDGGASWQIVANDLPVGDYQSRGRTSFVRPNLAWTKVWNDGIYKSTNGGQSWERIYAAKAPHALFFLNDSMGFYSTFGSPTGLFKTTDGGLSWSQKIFGAPLQWVRWAPGGKRLWAARETLYVSTNTGESWEAVLSNRAQGGCGTFQDAEFLTDDLGLVVGMCLVLGRSEDPVSVPSTQEASVPHLALQQNYPNPFNPTTVVSYELPVVSEVRLVVYDLLGREVSVLENGRKEAGAHEVRFDGTGLASGVYFYRLQAGTYVGTRKLLLLR